MKTEKFYLAKNINWDTDGQDVDLPSIVSLITFKNASLEEVKEEAADYLSDNYGYCVNGSEIKEVDETTYNAYVALDKLSSAIQSSDDYAYEIQHNCLDGDIDKSIMDLNIEWFTDQDNINGVIVNGDEYCICYDGGFEILV